MKKGYASECRDENCPPSEREVRRRFKSECGKSVADRFSAAADEENRSDAPWHLLNTLEARQSELSSLSTRHAGLEDVFVTLTGRHWRDQENNTP
jgi:hypothetical protein